MQEQRIILATNNAHKLKEFSQKLQREILSPRDLGIMDFDPIEDANTFEDNAMIKAKALYQKLQDSQERDLQERDLIILADDSGLCVELLNGEPGIFSARYANIKKNSTTQKNSDDKANRQALIQALKDKNLWGSPAFFQCSIAYIAVCQDSKKQNVVNGILKGIVAIKEIGEHGFGYDSMFFQDFENLNNEKKLDSAFFQLNTTSQDNQTNSINSLQHSLATLPLTQKNAISHRGKALQKLQEELKFL